MGSRAEGVEQVSSVRLRRWPGGFAGRTAELETLATELSRVSAGELRVVLVTGDAGIGKTTLAAEVAAGASDDVIALTARGHPIGAATPRKAGWA